MKGQLKHKTDWRKPQHINKRRSNKPSPPSPQIKKLTTFKFPYIFYSFNCL